MAEWLIAIGTILVAVIAVFGRWCRRQLFGPVLRLQKVVHPNEPEVDANGVWYWHLRVRNGLPSWALWLGYLRAWQETARNCRVRLRAFEKSDKADEFLDQSPVVPLQFRWPFSAALRASEIAAEPARSFRDIVSQDVIEFGTLEAQDGGGDPLFKPALHADDEGAYTETVCLTPGQTGRYHLEIISDQFVSRSPQVFDIHYDRDQNKPLEKRITIECHRPRRHKRQTERPT
jgi:hypothetical protein